MLSYVALNMSRHSARPREAFARFEIHHVSFRGFGTMSEARFVTLSLPTLVFESI
jgi:hypothetical protein